MVFAYYQSLGPIVVTALRISFVEERLGPATGGFACNCSVPETWTTEASGLSINSCGRNGMEVHYIIEVTNMSSFLLLFNLSMIVVAYFFISVCLVRGNDL